MRIMLATNILVITFVTVTLGKEFQFLSKTMGQVWIGVQGNAGKPHLKEGGFVLKPGEQVSIEAPDDWAGRFWARGWCYYKNYHCLSGDCGKKLECNGTGGEPPITLVEITLNAAGGLDYYHISLIDGFNFAISIEPIGHHGNCGQNSCKKAACGNNIKKDCPQPLKQEYHLVVGCKSACLAFNNDEYCCRGAYYSDPNKCLASSYDKFFKDRCPDAYVYAYNDPKSTFTCNAPTYLITIE